MAAAPPDALRGAPPPRPTPSNKLQYFKALGPPFKALLCVPPTPRGAPVIGPNCASVDQGRTGHFERVAGAWPGRGSLGADLVGDVLDPLGRSLAAPVLPSIVPSGSSPAGMPLSSPCAPDVAMVEEVVRRIAWGGDRRAGVARIELGGAHLGTAIVVRGSGREVALSIELGLGVNAGALPERLVARLKARGLAVTELEVR